MDFAAGLSLAFVPNAFGAAFQPRLRSEWSL
jgi:hypothetical protein